jgi:hypothetical protein
MLPISTGLASPGGIVGTLLMALNEGKCTLVGQPVSTRNVTALRIKSELWGVNRLTWQQACDN